MDYPTEDMVKKTGDMIVGDFLHVLIKLKVTTVPYFSFTHGYWTYFSLREMHDEKH
jgi:hypothetical protein